MKLGPPAYEIRLLPDSPRIHRALAKDTLDIMQKNLTEIIQPESHSATANKNESDENTAGHVTNHIQELDTKFSDTCWKVRHCVVAAQTEAQLLMIYGIKHRKKKLW